MDEARRRVDHLIVLVYPTDLMAVPLHKRAGWIRTLYKGLPRVTVVECPDGPQETGHDPIIMRLQEEYVKRVLTEKGLLREVTHFISSEWYGEHMAKSLDAINILIDQERRAVPISGTMVREWPFKWRRALHPIVYKDLVKKVVFLGAESTGKSTMAEYMASKYATQVMREYGREYWQMHNVNGRLDPHQLCNIACGHLEHEERLIYESDRYLFVDTNAITTYMFAMHYHGSALPYLADLAQKAETRYDLTFLCGDDIPYHEDGTREGDEHRHKFQRMIRDDLDRRGVKYTVLEGDLQDRVTQVEL
jgi:NadR type nicotinamide-nucleotide adenylyltransferase